MSEDEIWPAIINTGRVHPNALNTIVKGLVQEAKKTCDKKTKPKNLEEKISNNPETLYDLSGNPIDIRYKPIIAVGQHSKLYCPSLSGVMLTAYSIISKYIKQKINKANSHPCYFIETEYNMPILFAGNHGSASADIGRTDRVIEIEAISGRRIAEVTTRIFTHPSEKDVVLYQTLREEIVNYTKQSPEIIGAGVFTSRKKLPKNLKKFKPDGWQI